MTERTTITREVWALVLLALETGGQPERGAAHALLLAAGPQEWDTDLRQHVEISDVRRDRDARSPEVLAEILRNELHLASVARPEGDTP